MVGAGAVRFDRQPARPGPIVVIFTRTKQRGAALDAAASFVTDCLSAVSGLCRFPAEPLRGNPWVVSLESSGFSATFAGTFSGTFSGSFGTISFCTAALGLISRNPLLCHRNFQAGNSKKQDLTPSAPSIATPSARYSFGRLD